MRSLCDVNLDIYKCRVLYCSIACCNTHKVSCGAVKDGTSKSCLNFASDRDNNDASVRDAEGVINSNKRSIDEVSSDHLMTDQDNGGMKHLKTIDSQNEGENIVVKGDGDAMCLPINPVNPSNSDNFIDLGLISKETYSRLHNCAWLVDILKSKRLQEQIKKIDSLESPQLRSDALKQVRENNSEFDSFVQKLLVEIKKEDNKK